ncbi:hypothetical protein A3D66_00035 [Candidatus Kaiserbacteria bacterium RIFCSPHIGHO2_02_FULL_50_9]|uniref:Uncharacterized protein n=1 Tax=Candidatus Kaiserbacteria bacterium RIFCSPLOWO2_01_FULL_51_21 TaxID=1798508 RepID=A0A1F6EEI1_9BACT|nr:MAG: hypothetical protein A2761_00280 [Candidatus Kaiserbacteria bacterium RIFCSPHIGHO2_01_FULL_51_33]OGG63703.1 MAG: hypothetical protein A3D66_00035 [Candidatus Kaiserbacteria bacterium RIFCSPHIGHO2_02_FULL_50_9]OGG72061.1 MAG: hypothetical protein A3A35_00915 [Candidatus Kaiserbacteria bacterium RIFCSPLOWO2_01_FULL_51_21]
MEDLVEGYIFTSRDFATPSFNGGEFLFGHFDNRDSASKVGSQGLADELGAGAVLDFGRTVNERHHFGRQ